MTSIQLIHLALSIIIWFLGYFHNGKYVRPKWKIPGKLIFYIGISFTLIYFFNHFALIFIIGHPLIGFLFHLKVCKQHTINWITCEPKETYIALQEKWAKGDFSKDKGD